MTPNEHINFGTHEFRNSRICDHATILIDPRSKMMLLHWNYEFIAD